MVVKQQIGRVTTLLMLLKDADTQARWYYQLKIEFARAWPKIVLLAIRLGTNYCAGAVNPNNKS